MILKKETPQSLTLVKRGWPIQSKHFSTKDIILLELMLFNILMMSLSDKCYLCFYIWLVLAVIRPKRRSSLKV